MSSFDRAVTALAAQQYGAFSRRQVIALGGSPHMIKHRLQRGTWTGLHPAVYCLAGSHRSWQREQMAACLWSGGLTGVRAAAYLHGFPGFDPGALEVVTTRNLRPMGRCGVVVHHTSWLPAAQTVQAQGIPTTSVERTLLDLCGHVPKGKAAIALDQCLHQARTTLGCLDHCLYLTARRGRDGCGILRRLIQDRAALREFPNSPLETVIFEMLSASGLEMPMLQGDVLDEQGRFVARPDFVWREARLIVEGHGRLWHDGVAAQDRDRERHKALARLGYRILYVTWADATAYRASTLRRVAAELKAGRDCGSRADLTASGWPIGPLS